MTAEGRKAEYFAVGSSNPDPMGLQQTWNGVDTGTVWRSDMAS